MLTADSFRRLPRRVPIAAAFVVLTACSALRPAPSSPESASRPAAEAPPPAQPPAHVPATPSVRHNVVVLFESDTPEYAEVAKQLAVSLPPKRYSVALTDIAGATGAERLAALGDRDASVAVAIGRDAVEGARARLHRTPIVFCQVLNYEDLLHDGTIWGVEPLPPLELQLRAWRAVDPRLKRVGLIVSQAHADVVEAAKSEATRAGVEIRAETSGSDRETLYLFKRLAAEVDGFWLFPDNRILSPGVLRELLTYAQTHGVGVLVSNKSLLRWGALLSVTTRPADVAARVRGIVERIADGRTQGLPSLTPLSAVEVQLNPRVAARLGASDASREPWVVRERD